MKNISFCLFIFFSINIFSATNYYVDGTNGSDSNNGLTAETAWKTFAKAFDKYTDRNSGGNGVIINIASGTYSDKITVPYQWTKGSTYETGIHILGIGTVVLTKSVDDQISTHTVDSNIHTIVMDEGFTNDIQSVIIDDQPLWYNNVETVDSEGDWSYDTETNTLLFYSTESDPNIRILQDKGKTNNDPSIYMTANSYVKIENIQFECANFHAIWSYSTCDHLWIENCSFKYCYLGGIRFAYGSSYTKVTNSTFQWNVLRNFPGGYWNSDPENIDAGGWPPAVASHGDYAEVSNCTVEWNWGEGIILIRSSQGSVAYDNTVNNNWSANIYCDNVQNGKVYNNIIINASSILEKYIRWDYGTDLAFGKIARRLRAIAIMNADEVYGSQNISEYNKYFNNYIVNCKFGFNHYGQGALFGQTGLKYVYFYQNTCIAPAEDGSQYNDDFYSAIVPEYSASIGTKLTNNIFLTLGDSTNFWKKEPDDEQVELYNNFYDVDTASYDSSKVSSSHVNIVEGELVAITDNIDTDDLYEFNYDGYTAETSHNYIGCQVSFYDEELNYEGEEGEGEGEDSPTYTDFDNYRLFTLESGLNTLVETQSAGKTLLKGIYGIVQNACSMYFCDEDGNKLFNTFYFDDNSKIFNSIYSNLDITTDEDKDLCIWASADPGTNITIKTSNVE